MKTIRVLVLLLLASVHVFTPVSSDAPDPTGHKRTDPPTLPTSAATVSHAPVTTPAAPTTAPTPTPTTAQTPTTAHQDATGKAAASTKAADAPAPPAVTTPSSHKDASTPKSRTTVAPVTPTDAVTKSERLNDTLNPRGFDVPKVANSTDDKETDAPGAAVSTHLPKPSKGTSVITTVAPQHKTNAAEEKGAGSQTGGDSRTPPQSDKRLWWILLPVLLVGAAAAIVLRFKCKKVHDHIETIDTGTENASFQSRPESTKDGVMLLGVKSSGGDESAAAR